MRKCSALDFLAVLYLLTIVELKIQAALGHKIAKHTLLRQEHRRH